MLRRLSLMGLVLFSVLVAQGWEKVYGIREDGARCVQETPDGGYIITGYTSSLGQPLDMWLLKTNALGDTLWTRGYGGASVEIGYCVQKTQDGGYIIVGSTRSSSIAINGDNDIWVVKTDSLGDTLWTKVYGGKQDDSGYWIEQTSDGGYIVTARTGSFSIAPIPGFSLWLLKLDSLGDTLWTALHCGVAGKRVLDAEGRCVVELEDGYVVSGQVFNSEKEGLWILRTDTLGDTIWTRKYGSSACDAAGFCIKRTLDNGFVVAGYDRMTHSVAWLLKTDSMGDTLWIREWAGNGGGGVGFSVDLTSDSGYIMTGKIDNDLCLIKVDSDGNTEWMRKFAGEAKVMDQGYCVKQTSDGGYIIVGEKDRITLSYFAKAWLLKTDSLGYVGVGEFPAISTSNWQLVSSVGHQIVLQYADMATGFHASIFDASGCKVDELHASSTSGTLSWGSSVPSGVYFIRELSTPNSSSVHKVVLIR